MDRKTALATLQNSAVHKSAEVYRCVVGLSRSPDESDVEVLLPLLKHTDDMVDSATLNALLNVYDCKNELRHVVFTLAGGDERDTGEMSIQLQAIECLAFFAADDKPSLRRILEVADYPATAECPRSRAWGAISLLVGEEWSDELTRVMIWDANGEAAQRIRSELRRKIAEAKRWLKEA